MYYVVLVYENVNVYVYKVQVKLERGSEVLEINGLKLSRAKKTFLKFRFKNKEVRKNGSKPAINN